MTKKVALITGASSGVGSETAKMLAQEGWNVVINFTRSLKEAEETVEACKAYGAEALLVQADVSDDDSCKSMVQRTMDTWGRIDALVNNAGKTKPCAMDNLDGLDKQDFLDIYAVNVVGSYHMARAVAPIMKAQGEGVIVNNASIAGLTGVGSSMAYAASKGALNTLTLSLAKSLGPEIRVNCVCPGFIEGRWTKGWVGEEQYKEITEDYASQATLGRVLQPKDVAESIVYFVTQAKHITGEIMVVDAGYTLNQVPIKRG